MGKRTFFTGAFVLGAVLLMTATGRPAAAQSSPLPSCIKVRSEARYVPYGYRHVVILKNTCEKDATCTVFTDVNPAPSTTDVAKGTTQEVLTFSGSPASAFTATVTCNLH